MSTQSFREHMLLELKKRDSARRSPSPVAPTGKQEIDNQAPTRQSIARDGQAIIDAIERLYADLEKVQGKENDTITRLKCQYTCNLIDDVVTAMAHPPTAPRRTCDTCGDWIFDYRFDERGNKVDHPDHCPTCDDTCSYPCTDMCPSVDKCFGPD